MWLQWSPKSCVYLSVQEARDPSIILIARQLKLNLREESRWSTFSDATPHCAVRNYADPTEAAKEWQGQISIVLDPIRNKSSRY